MSIGKFCNREVVVVERECTIAEAARLMRQHHVGSLVVVDEDGGPRRPVALLTDRDLVVEVLAADLDGAKLRVGDVVSEPLYSVRESEGVFETMRLMRERGVRRAPVVDAGGGLQGIVCVDDLIALLAEEMDELARLIAREQARETRQRG